MYINQEQEIKFLKFINLNIEISITSFTLLQYGIVRARLSGMLKIIKGTFNKDQH